MPHPREVAAKPLPKPSKVHHGHHFALCGQKAVGMMLTEMWSHVDCRACLRVQRARHDKPCR